MLNPDRLELGLSPTSASETPKKVEGPNKDIVEKPGAITRRDLLKGAAGVAVVGALRVKPVSAEGTPSPTVTPSSTSTPTASSTPDADATKEAGLHTAIAEQKKSNARQTVIAGLEKEATALAQPPTGIPTPTETKTPTPTPNIDATREAIHKDAVKELANRYERAAADAKASQTATPTPSPTPTQTPTPTPTPDTRLPVIGGPLGDIKEKGFPWTEVVGVVAVIGVGLANISRRFRSTEGAMIRGAGRVPGRIRGFIGRFRGHGGPPVPPATGAGP